MKNVNLGPEIGLIRLLLNNEVRRTGQFEDVDWTIFRRLLDYHEIGPYLYVNTKSHINPLPQRFRNLLFNNYWYTVRDNILKNRCYQDIFSAFQDKGIDLLPIKGIALLNDIYKKHYMRPMGDIDALIPEKDYRKSEELLLALGYEKKLMGLTDSYWRDNQCHVTFRSSGNILELHWGLDFKRRGKAVLPHIWDRTREVQCNNGSRKLRLLSPEDTLFSLALHQRRYGKVFCLKYVMDVNFLLERYQESFDWDYMLDSCTRERLSSCLYFLLFQVKLFFYRKDINLILNKLSVPDCKKNVMQKFISDNINSHALLDKHKDNYLRSHFLLYDSYTEPIKYIISIPLEQFAKFYGFKPYAVKTRILHKLRFIYFIFRGLVNLVEVK